MAEKIAKKMLREHERLAMEFDDFKNGEEQDKLFKRFSEDLKSHFKLEEQIIDSLFSKEGFGKEENLLPIAQSIKLEHKKILELLEEVSKSVKNKTAIDTSEFSMILERHRNVEDRLFYPKLDKVLSEEEK